MLPLRSNQLLFTATALTVALSGCCISTGIKYTKIKGETPIAMRFTSARAASTFYSTFFNKAPSEQTEIALFLKGNLGVTHEVTDTVRVNHAFKAADKDHDGIVTEQEALTYAQSCGAAQKIK